jgi:hypothetical protein
MRTIKAEPGKTTSVTEHVRSALLASANLKEIRRTEHKSQQRAPLTIETRIRHTDLRGNASYAAVDEEGDLVTTSEDNARIAANRTLGWLAFHTERIIEIANSSVYDFICRTMIAPSGLKKPDQLLDENKEAEMEANASEGLLFATTRGSGLVRVAKIGEGEFRVSLPIKGGYLYPASMFTTTEQDREAQLGV